MAKLNYCPTCSFAGKPVKLWNSRVDAKYCPQCELWIDKTTFNRWREKETVPMRRIVFSFCEKIAKYTYGVLWEIITFFPKLIINFFYLLYQELSFTPRWDK